MNESSREQTNNSRYRWIAGQIDNELDNAELAPVIMEADSGTSQDLLSVSCMETRKGWGVV